MRRTTFLTLAVIALGYASESRAQFPVFYGGEVLTPFGNRGSDGSYRYPSRPPRRQVVARPRQFSSAARYYFVPQGSYYTPFPGSTYATPQPTRYVYVRRWR
jgi:hypothetical protein